MWKYWFPLRYLYIYSYYTLPNSAREHSVWLAVLHHLWVLHYSVIFKAEWVESQSLTGSFHNLTIIKIFIPLPGTTLGVTANYLQGIRIIRSSISLGCPGGGHIIPFLALRRTLFFCRPETIRIWPCCFRAQRMRNCAWMKPEMELSDPLWSPDASSSLLVSLQPSSSNNPREPPELPAGPPAGSSHEFRQNPSQRAAWYPLLSRHIFGRCECRVHGQSAIKIPSDHP